MRRPLFWVGLALIVLGLVMVFAGTPAHSAPPQDTTVGYAYQRQQNGYYCGPAATRIVASTYGTLPSQDYVAGAIGTTVNGTDSVAGPAGLLHQRAHRGGDGLYAAALSTLNQGRGLVLNVVGSAGGHSYPGGHYVAVVGYRSGGAELLIADPWDGIYWLSTQDSTSWARGYTDLPQPSESASDSSPTGFPGHSSGTPAALPQSGPAQGPGLGLWGPLIGVAALVVGFVMGRNEMLKKYIRVEKRALLSGAVHQVRLWIGPVAFCAKWYRDPAFRGFDFNVWADRDSGGMDVYLPFVGHLGLFSMGRWSE